MVEKRQLCDVEVDRFCHKNGEKSAYTKLHSPRNKTKNTSNIYQNLLKHQQQQEDNTIYQNLLKTTSFGKKKSKEKIIVTPSKRFNQNYHI